ncbi:MAG: hypothetical protein AMK71_08165 [Nitrospira bacterium SG8_35_4]|nr:MAG: hypothetical protein AMK71_08165 [Nitrospira bacterium SG8_35_4]
MNQRETNAQKKLDSNWVWFLFSFKGRISRKPFWIFNLIVFIGGILLGMFTDFSGDVNEMSKPQLMFMIWVLWPSMAVQAKRWHDVDKSALWIFINLIPDWPDLGAC